MAANRDPSLSHVIGGLQIPVAGEEWTLKHVSLKKKYRVFCLEMSRKGNHI